MSEEEEEPFYCPSCKQGSLLILGRTDDKFYIVRCKECETDWMIREVTGKVKIMAVVEE